MSSFKLHSEDSEFNNRVDALFNTLQTVAVDLEPEDSQTSSTKPTGSGKRTWEERSRSEESEESSSSFTIGNKFKKPAGFPPRLRGRGQGPRNSTPDYVKNPQNWVRYSMKDTKVSSDRENTQIALDLFDELRSRRKDEEPTEEDDCQKIVFKKPSKTDVKENDDSDDSKDTNNSADALFGGSRKIRMSEYQVGQPKRKSKPKVRESSEEKERKNKVSLDYLNYDDEDVDEDS